MKTIFSKQAIAGAIGLSALLLAGAAQAALLESTVYWSSSEYPGHPDFAMVFSMVYGDQGGAFKSDRTWLAMAVRDGDVAAIPEPETYALMLAGLAGLALARRQRRP